MREYGAVNIYVIDYCEINIRRNKIDIVQCLHIFDINLIHQHILTLSSKKWFSALNLILLFVWYTIRSTKLVWQLTVSQLNRKKCWACIKNNSGEEEKIATDIEKLLISLYCYASSISMRIQHREFPFKSWKILKSILQWELIILGILKSLQINIFLKCFKTKHALQFLIF